MRHALIPIQVLSELDEVWAASINGRARHDAGHFAYRPQGAPVTFTLVRFPALS